MDRRLYLLVAVVVTVCSIDAAAIPTPAPATLVKAVPLAIEIKGDGSGRRSFTLNYHSRAAGLVADRGSALRFVATHATSRLRDGTSRLELAGTELLEGALGTMTLHWSGIQRRSDGHWGDARGIWSIVSGTGVYAGRTGRGRFISCRATTEYQGSLITAE
jgi:hypothetical protein